jgi:hypothetical protein
MACWGFSLGTSVSSTNKTDHCKIIEILLCKVLKCYGKMRAGELFVNIQSLSNAHILKPASNPVEANLRTFIDPAIGASMSVLCVICIAMYRL